MCRLCPPLKNPPTLIPPPSSPRLFSFLSVTSILNFKYLYLGYVNPRLKYSAIWVILLHMIRESSS